VSILKFVGDALAHPGWQAMLDEISALQNSGT